MKNTFIFLMLMSITNNTLSQENKLHKLVSVGISQAILNNGTGLHGGLNPSFELSKIFSLEGQLSHIYTNIEDYFNSGDYGSSNDINLLAGGRIYLNSREKKNRFFMNLLFGLNYERDDKIVDQAVNYRKIREEYRLGFSVGGFYCFKKLNFGLTYDSHHMVLKFGYNF